MQAGPSRTAAIVAVGRGQHRLNDAAPWVFDDAYALSLVGAEWPQIFELVGALVPAHVFPQASAALLVRARYTEDRLEAGNFSQYVVLGAGLDSFAWRRPDALQRMTVFEVDHPESQAYKRARAAELALPTSERHRFAPVDFERETLAAALDGAGFDWSAPTLFSWLGVTMYLSIDAIEATLRTVAKAGAGSEIVFSYGADESERDELGNQFAEVFGAIAAASGEPFESFFTRPAIEDVVTGCGLHVAEHPTREVLHRRYCADRTDGITPITAERLLTAAV